MKLALLITDQDAGRTASIERALTDSFDCCVARNFDEAYTAVARDEFWAALIAYSSKDEGSGLELLQGFRDLVPRTFRILYSTQHSNALVRDATRLARVHAVLDASDPGFLKTLRDTLDKLHATLEAPMLELGSAPAIHESTPWCAVSMGTQTFLKELRHAAESERTVFIHGEPGSSKHLAALTLQRWRREWKSRQRVGRATPADSASTTILRVPPLRERMQDLPSLAEEILSQHVRLTGGPALRLTPAVLKALSQREWRGNVRELSVVLRRAVAAARATGHIEIGVEHLAGHVEPARSPSQYRKDEGQLDAVMGELRAAGSVRGAAKLERIPRANYMRMMRRLGVIRADARPYGEDEPEEHE